jgi:elongation factor P
MVLASEVKVGTVLQFEEKLYRVLEVIRHAGSGQMHGFIELKLLDLKFHHFADRRFKHSDKLDEIELTKKIMEYLYNDSDNFYFMDTVTFEQCTVPSSAVGNYGRFMKEGTNFTVELNGEEAIAIQLPKLAEMKIVSTGEGIKDGQDNTMKSATLENGVEIFVPQFLETGDVVRVDTEKIRYYDRVTTKK